MLTGGLKVSCSGTRLTHSQEYPSILSISYEQLMPEANSFIEGGYSGILASFVSLSALCLGSTSAISSWLVLYIQAAMSISQARAANPFVWELWKIDSRRFGIFVVLPCVRVK